jgi:hypothetical protein
MKHILHLYNQVFSFPFIPSDLFFVLRQHNVYILFIYIVDCILVGTSQSPLGSYF